MGVSHTIDEQETAEIRVQFLDTLGRPLAASDVTAAVVTLYDVDSAAVINSRTAVDIFDTNGGAAPNQLTITGASQEFPCVVNCADHGLLSGDKVLLDSIAGMTELNGRVFVVDRLSDDTFALRGVDARRYTEYTSGGVGETGILSWVMLAADNAIVGTAPAVGRVQRHKAEITITYSGGKTARAVVDLAVRNLQKVT